MATRTAGGICYTLTRKAVKNLNLRVRPDGSVAVSAPKRVPAVAVDAFVLRHAGLIAGARERLAARPGLALRPGAAARRRGTSGSGGSALPSSSGQRGLPAGTETGCCCPGRDLCPTPTRGSPDGSKGSCARWQRPPWNRSSRYWRPGTTAPLPNCCCATPRSRYGSCRPAHRGHHPLLPAGALPAGGGGDGACPRAGPSGGSGSLDSLLCGGRRSFCPVTGSGPVC